MYIKPSNPILRSDQGGKALKVNKKTDSGTESFKDLLEEIDIIELSSELDPDGKKKKDPQRKQEDRSEQAPAVVPKEVPEHQLVRKVVGVNKFV